MNKREPIVSTHTKRILRAKGIFIQDMRHKAEVIRKRQKVVFGNYNLLEYNSFVARYLMNKYDVSRTQLDQICFLYPREVFSLKDYTSWPISHPQSSLKTLQSQGLLIRYLKAGHETIFCLSNKAKRIVELYHRYLLDFSRMPQASLKPHLYGNKGAAYGKKLSSLISKLQAGA